MIKVRSNCTPVRWFRSSLLLRDPSYRACLAACRVSPLRAPRTPPGPAPRAALRRFVLQKGSRQWREKLSYLVFWLVETWSRVSCFPCLVSPARHRRPEHTVQQCKAWWEGDLFEQLLRGAQSDAAAGLGEQQLVLLATELPFRPRPGRGQLRPARAANLTSTNPHQLDRCRGFGDG